MVVPRVKGLVSRVFIEVRTTSFALQALAPNILHVVDHVTLSEEFCRVTDFAARHYSSDLFAV